MLTPDIIALIQSNLMMHINDALQTVAHSSIQLLYLFAALELAFFGIGWAFNRSGELAGLVINVFYIGFILFVINNFSYLLNHLIRGFIYIGLKISPEHALKILSNPTEIFRYGFDASISILKISVHYGTTNLSGSFLYLFLGFGALILFALLAAQTICLVVAFYFIALTTLIILPFTIFRPLKDMLSRSMQQLLRAGIKVMILMIVLSVAASLWLAYPMPPLSPTTSLVAPFGFFFSVLTTLFLALRLPSLAAAAVGNIRLNLLSHSQAEINVMPTSTVVAPAPASTNLQSVDSPVAQAAHMNVNTDINITQATDVNTHVNSVTEYGPKMNEEPLMQTSQRLSNTLARASKRHMRLSNKMVRQLKNTLKEVLNETKKKS